LAEATRRRERAIHRFKSNEGGGFQVDFPNEKEKKKGGLTI